MVRRTTKPENSDLLAKTIENIDTRLPSGLNTKTLTLAEQIANRIADLIISGKYQPGQRVSEQELASLFSVSRGPVREALRILEKEDFVRILPRRFTEITRLSPREVEQIFEIRAALISLAARLTTERITEDVTHYMQWSIPEVEQRAAADNVGEFLRLVYRLSMFLTESSRNEKLEAMFVSMSRQTLALTHRVLSKSPNRKRWARNWQRLARAIVKGDVDGASGAANQLVLETGRWVEEEARMMDEPEQSAQASGNN